MTKRRNVSSGTETQVRQRHDFKVNLSSRPCPTLRTSAAIARIDDLFSKSERDEACRHGADIENID